MSIQEQRLAKFEAYIREKHPQSASTILQVLPGTTGYRWAETVQRWEDWNAALDSVEIELPGEQPEPALPLGHPDKMWPVGWNTALGECRAVIEAAGLKVKP